MAEITKPEDKGSSIVVWDRVNYLAEAENQFNDSNTYKEVKEQVKLVPNSNSMFEGLKKKRVITEKNYFENYFELRYPHRKLFGILRSLFAASNKRRKILYMKYRWDLSEKTVGAILVTTDMVEIYSSISHIEGLEVLRKQYGKFLHKKVPTEDIIKMAENVLKKCFWV